MSFHRILWGEALLASQDVRSMETICIWKFVYVSTACPSSWVTKRTKTYRRISENGFISVVRRTETKTYCVRSVEQPSPDDTCDNFSTLQQAVQRKGTIRTSKPTTDTVQQQSNKICPRLDHECKLGKWRWVCTQFNLGARSGWSTSHSGRFTPQENSSRYPLNMGLVSRTALCVVYCWNTKQLVAWSLYWLRKNQVALKATVVLGGNVSLLLSDVSVRKINSYRQINANTSQESPKCLKQKWSTWVRECGFVTVKKYIIVQNI